MKGIFCFAAGAVTAVAVTALMFENKFKHYKSEKEGEISSLQNTKNSLQERLSAQEKDIAQLKDENSELSKKLSVLMNAYENVCTFYSKLTNGFNIILNPDMLADIASIKDVELRDKCLEEIEDAVASISKHIVHKSELMADDDKDKLIDKIECHIETMCDNIKHIIIEYEESDDEDGDEGTDGAETVSPKKLILKGVDCDDRIFETDPDIGFEVLSGPEEGGNSYCIYAQNDAKLYNFLRDSIKDQMASHYTAKIDPEVFDNIIEDIVITVSFSFINETDAVITEVAAAIQFEVFSNKNNYYHVKGGDIDHDHVVHYIRVNNTPVNSDIGEKDVPKNGDETTSTEEKTVEINPVEFLVETIDYNQAEITAFIKKLIILEKANNEAWCVIYNSFNDILSDIIKLNESNELTELKKAEFVAQIKALNKNMKRNYGADINLYKQTH